MMKIINKYSINTNLFIFIYDKLYNFITTEMLACVTIS
jgi:hypothetical protein